LTYKTVSQITYTVLVETLNPAQSINQSINQCWSTVWSRLLMRSTAVLNVCSSSWCCIVSILY